MKKIPTDVELLNAIYKRYYDTYTNFTKEDKTRETKYYVPIDCAEIAKTLGVDGDIIFGRLYYHLENKYGYTRKDGTKVQFFSLKVGDDSHCVNFPYLASVLATLRTDHKRFKVTAWGVIAAFLVVFATAYAANMAARSAGFARESSDVAKESVKLMLLANRPYLHITCDKSIFGCLGQTGLSFILDSKRKCFEQLSFYFINGGKTPAEIIRSKYSIIFYRHDEIPITMYYEPDERVFIFPDKPSRKLISKSVKKDVKATEICNIREIEFNVNVDYSMPTSDRNIVYNYELSYRHNMETKRGDIIFEKMK